MSFLAINGSIFRLGCTGVANASKILSSNSAPTVTALSSSSLFASSGNGRVFTAKYYHTLKQQQQENQKGVVSSSSGNINKSMNMISKRMSSTGDHVTLWTAERILSAALVPILPLALIMPCAPLDYLVAFGLTVHSHWGIEAIVVDYVRPSVFGPVIPKLAVALVYGLSVMTLGGLFYFIYSDVGIGQAVRMLWKL